VIVLGGTMGVHDTAEHSFLSPLMRFMADAAEGGTPLLGICLGGQLLSAALGGVVTASARGERGLRDIALTTAGADDPLFAGMPARFAAFEWHNDSFDVPPGAVHLAATEDCPGQAFRYGNAWGVQFHPEVDAHLVAAWSAKIDPGGRHLRAFAAAEAAHRRMAIRLLENFLTFAGRQPGVN
jgi:GMP synthase-like glutamine amidotransferase